MNNKIINRYSILSQELMFVLLPFIVIVIIHLYKNDFNSFWYSAEWSFASSILIGQTIVKIFIGGSSGKKKVYSERAALIISALIVLLLVPSLIILTLILISDKASIWLAIFQVLFFIVSIFVFYVFGGAGHALTESEEKNEITQMTD